VEFKVGNSVNSSGDATPYYSDGRQTIFEAGGPLSGFNVYISQGYICFGMWNRFERKYIKYTNGTPSFYPLTPNSIYLANLEFDGANKRIRAAITQANSTATTYSNWYSFSGLTNDPTSGSSSGDWSGVGGASRTSYYDYNTGETYSDHFGGQIGGIWLYNSFLPANSPALDAYYNNLGHLLGTGYSFVIPSDNSNQNSQRKPNTDWKLIEGQPLPDNQYSENGAGLSPAYPNPFTTTTSFGINLPDKQIVNVELFDAMGNRVKTIYAGELSSGVHDFTIDGTSLNSGMYLYKVTGEGFVQSGKVVLSK
jgi:hypothetical protein